MTSPLLQVDDLCFAYPQRELFSQWSARLGPGIHLVQGGESRGKTTLMRLLAGEVAAQSGQLCANGVWLAQAPQAYRQQVFWVDPRTEAFDQQTMDACFALLGQRYPAFDTGQLPALIDGLSLDEHRHKPLYMLSTGSKRKVWLAAAFAAGAPVTLLDVPFASLDKASIRFVTEQLCQQAKVSTRAWVFADYEAPLGLPFVSTLDLGD